jgi:crotonobetainyl-CoA:carnitine CoA-transferase CaiB-like acyl-CoA transferase
MEDRSPPLARFTVLDLTRVRAGQTCVRQLADWGANVLKLELPEAVEGNAALGGATPRPRLPEPAP